jgi:hypothetical protein
MVAARPVIWRCSFPKANQAFGTGEAIAFPFHPYRGFVAMACTEIVAGCKFFF